MLPSVTPLDNKPLHQATPPPSGFKEQWKLSKAQRREQADASEKMVKYDREGQTVREGYFKPSAFIEKKPEKRESIDVKSHKSATNANLPKPSIKVAHLIAKNPEPHDVQSQEDTMPKEGKSILKGQRSEEPQRHPVAFKITKKTINSNNKKENSQQLAAEGKTNYPLKKESQKRSLADTNIEKKQSIKEHNLLNPAKKLQEDQGENSQPLKTLQQTNLLDSETPLNYQAASAVEKTAEDVQTVAKKTLRGGQKRQLSLAKKEGIPLKNQQTNIVGEQSKTDVAAATEELSLKRSLKSQDEQETNNNINLKPSKTAPTLPRKEPSLKVNNGSETIPLKTEKAEIIVESAPLEGRSNAAPTTRMSFSQMVESRVNQLLEGPQGQLVKQLQIQLSNQQQAEIRLSLQPEQLGEVRLHLRLQGEQARTQISVEQSSTAELMQEALSSFAQSFSEHGYEQTEFDITVEKTASSSLATLSEVAPSLMEQGGDFLLHDQLINYIV